MGVEDFSVLPLLTGGELSESLNENYRTTAFFSSNRPTLKK